MFKKLFKQIKQYSQSSSDRRKHRYHYSGSSSSRHRHKNPYGGSHRYKRKGRSSS
ncbi:hypothetical protein [Virgibacillus ndiopensis]|uniref:hypothetical protein n=1 Tax=Virgibacillus ndiopensis TaxID=2004408 RepID=UPI00159BE537|nr:hypothetical protein [Virgibacillus ndiopensis]